jgi:hypothetical protein
MDECVGCTQVYSDIQRKKTQQPVEGIESQCGILLLRFPAQILYHGAKITDFFPLPLLFDSLFSINTAY